MSTFDLFWRPAVGDLVAIKPGTHAAMLRSAREMEHPLRVVRDAGEVSGHPMVWCTPTWPVTTRVDRRGRTITEVPTSQAPMLVEELLPVQDPA